MLSSPSKVRKFPPSLVYSCGWMVKIIHLLKPIVLTLWRDGQIKVEKAMTFQNGMPTLGRPSYQLVGLLLKMENGLSLNLGKAAHRLN